MAFMTTSQTGASGDTFTMKFVLAVLFVALSARGAAADCDGFSCVAPATAECGNTPTPRQATPCTTPGAVYCRYDGSLPSTNFTCANTPVFISQYGTNPIFVTLTATSGSFVDYVAVHGGNANCQVPANATTLGSASVQVSTPSQTNKNGGVTAKGFSNVGFCFLPCACASVRFTDSPTDPSPQCPGYSGCPSRSAVDNCGNPVTPTCAITGPDAVCGTATQTWTATCPGGSNPVTSTQAVTITDGEVSFGFSDVGGCPSPSGCPTATSTCNPGGISDVSKSVAFTDEASCAAKMTFTASNACGAPTSVDKPLAICDV